MIGPFLTGYLTGAGATGGACLLVVSLWLGPGAPHEPPQMEECGRYSPFAHIEYHRYSWDAANETAHQFHAQGWANITSQARPFGGVHVQADCPESRHAARIETY